MDSSQEKHAKISEEVDGKRPNTKGIVPSTPPPHVVSKLNKRWHVWANDWRCLPRDCVSCWKKEEADSADMLLAIEILAENGFLKRFFLNAHTHTPALDKEIV